MILQPGRKIIKIFILLFLCLSILAISAISARCENFVQEKSIGGFSPGEKITVLKKLGMPFPNDTGGIHSFKNIKENVTIRFALESGKSAPVIKWIQLAYTNAGARPETASDHQMLTGSTLSAFSTGAGIFLGDHTGKVEEKYGVPWKKDYRGKNVTWIYLNGKGGEAGILVIGFLNGKVNWIRLEGKSDDGVTPPGSP
jgi:hypothetical protein